MSTVGIVRLCPTSGTRTQFNQDLGAGIATVAGGGSGSQIAWLDVGIGAVCIGIIPGREERYKMHLRQAVELYNDAQIEYNAE